MAKNDSISVSRKSLTVLRLGIGIVCLWVSILKFLSGASQAEELVINTIATFTGGMLSPGISILPLAVWETLAGIQLLAGIVTKGVLGLLHAASTFIPLLLFPGLSFGQTTFGFTLLG
jgi:hypothetical protein